MPIDEKILATAGYAVGFVSIVLYFTHKDNKFIRFHAVQAFLAHVGIAVSGMALLALAFGFSIILLMMGIPLGMFIMLGVPLFMFAEYLALLFFALKAYKGENFKLPIIGNIAEQHSA